MRILSWNMNAGFAYRTQKHEEAWQWLRDTDADVLLLQETVVPAWAADEFNTVIYHEQSNRSRTKWGTAVLTRSGGWSPYDADDAHPWLHELAGSFVIAEPITAELPWLVSMHSSASFVPTDRLALHDHSQIRRCHGSRIWEIELAAHELERLMAGQRFILGGDTNSTLLLDNPSKTANADLFANLLRGGFHDLRTPPPPAPEPRTFFRDQKPFQLDYFFTDATSAHAATGWSVLTNVAAERGLSDHAPIQVDVP